MIWKKEYGVAIPPWKAQRADAVQTIKVKMEAALASGDPSSLHALRKKGVGEIPQVQPVTDASSWSCTNSDWVSEGDSWDSVTLPRRLQILWGPRGTEFGN